jgi:hypothetical protein
MWIKMTAGTGKVRVEQCMVHYRYWPFSALMFHMAFQTMFTRCVKTDSWFHRLDIAEKVALLARRITHTLPWIMADGAGGELCMGRSQATRLRRFIPEEKRHSCSDCNDQNEIGDQLLNHNQRSPK